MLTDEERLECFCGSQLPESWLQGQDGDEFSCLDCEERYVLSWWDGPILMSLDR
jgi:hypothetical protein